MTPFADIDTLERFRMVADCPLCAWPGCQSLSNRQRRLPRSIKFVALCLHHARVCDALSMTDMERMPWQPPRRRPIA